MNTKDKVILSAKLGEEAFHAGKPSAPALSKDCMALIAGNRLEDGFQHRETMKVLRAYSKAWHEANLSAPIPNNSWK